MDVEPRMSPILKLPAYEFPVRAPRSAAEMNDRVRIRDFVLMRTVSGEVFYSESACDPDPACFETIERHTTSVDVDALARGIFDVEMKAEALVWAEVTGFASGTPRPDTAPGDRLRRVLDVMWRSTHHEKRGECTARATEIAYVMHNRVRFP